MAGEITPVPSLDTSTLSPKQLDMATARHPMSGNQSNQLLAEQSAANKALDTQRKGIASTQQVQQQQAIAPQAQTQAGSAAAGSMQKNLTTFSNRLAAKVNNLLSGGDVNKLAIADSAELQPVWDEATQQFVIPDIGEIGYDTEALAQQKQQELAGIQQEMSPLFDYQQIGEQINVQAKSFEDVLKQFADLDGDGQLDPEEQRYLNDSFQIATAIQRLEKLNPDSPESISLRRQLQMMDEQGLVSGIYRAMDQYRALTGEGKGPEFYGELGQGNFNIESLINMNQDAWEAELNKALIGQESLFGQDFESALTQNRLRSNFAKSLAFDAETRNALTQAARYWGDQTKETLEQYYTEINEGFQEAYPKLQQYFQGLIQSGEAEGQNTDNLKAALQWFDDIAAGKDGNDPAKAISQLISDPDSGLAMSQRQVLSKWIGEMSGTDLGSTGIIAGVLNSIRETGGIDIAMDDPNTPEIERAKIEFSDNERLQVAKVLADNTLTDPEKAEKINAMVQRKITERIDASGDITAIQKYFDEGNFDTGLEVFVESLGKSLATFANSATNFLWNKVVTERAGEFDSEEGLTPEGDPRDFVAEDAIQDIQGAMESEATKLRGTIAAAVANTDKIESDIEAADADMATIDQLSTDLSTIVNREVTSLTQQIRNEVTNTGLDGNFQTLVAGWSKMAQRNGIPVDRIDWGQLDTYAEVFTMANNLQQMLLRGGRDSALLQQSPVFQQLAPYINDPMSLVKKFNPFFGGDMSKGVSRSVVATMNTLKKNLDQLVTNTAPKIFYESGYGKGLAAKREAISTKRNDIRNYLRDADAAIERLNQYAATGDRAIQALTTFNPNDVAEMAMTMARAAEAGATSPTQFIDMSKWNLSKEDFEKLSNGYGSIPPLYVRSAVQPLGEWEGYTTPVAGTSQGLRQWEGGISRPTSRPTVTSTPVQTPSTDMQERLEAPGTGYVSTGGQPYVQDDLPDREPIKTAPSRKIELDPTEWSIGGWKPFG